MKVIGQPKPWTLKKTCPDCKSRLLIEAADVRRGEFGAMGDYDTEYYVTCVSCSSTIRFGMYHEARQIPDHIKDRAKE